MPHSVSLKIIVEDSASKREAHTWAQHGLSIFLDLDLGLERMKLLWDTGATAEVMLHNALALNIDLSDIDLICLSHGHYDHTGGLLSVLQERKGCMPVIFHPDVFAPKLKAAPALKFIGPPLTPGQAEAKGGVLLECRGPVPLAPGVMTTGEIPRREDCERVEGFWTIRDGCCIQDTIPDDQALAISLPGKGLVVITGCAHSGVINTINYALEITGEKKLYALVGGFHLMGADESRIDATVRALCWHDPAILLPGHCTGERAVCRLKRAFGERCRPLAVGDLIQIK